MRTTLALLIVLISFSDLVLTSSDIWIRRHNFDGPDVLSPIFARDGYSQQLIMTLKKLAHSEKDFICGHLKNLGNGKLYVFNGTDLSPEDIDSVDIQITATYVRKESATHPVHAIRISWTPAKNAAAYRVHCEANSTDEVVTIFDKEIVDEITEVDERFVLPRGPLSVICCVAAANKHGASLWTYSPMVTIRSLNNEAHRESIRGRWKSTASEDLTTDQLLKLIHGSETMDLPTKPIIRPPEEPIIIRPKQPKYFSIYERQRPYKSLSFDIDAKELEQDYETVEREIRESIGAMDASKNVHHDSEQISGFLNRVL